MYQQSRDPDGHTEVLGTGRNGARFIPSWIFRRRLGRILQEAPERQSSPGHPARHAGRTLERDTRARRILTNLSRSSIRHLEFCKHPRKRKAGALGQVSARVRPPFLTLGVRGYDRLRVTVRRSVQHVTVRRSTRQPFTLMVTGSVSLNVTGVSGARWMSFFPVRRATVVPAPAPIGPPISAPVPPPARAPTTAPPAAPPPIHARLRFLWSRPILGEVAVRTRSEEHTSE